MLKDKKEMLKDKNSKKEGVNSLKLAVLLRLEMTARSEHGKPERARRGGTGPARGGPPPTRQGTGGDSSKRKRPDAAMQLDRASTKG